MARTVARLIVTVVWLLICLIPTAVFLFLQRFMRADGFWQMFVIPIYGYPLLAILQVVLLIVCVRQLWRIWTSD